MPAAIYELYREFRTNRRPLNVASVVSRTVRAGEFIYGGRHPPRPRGAPIPNLNSVIIITIIS